MKFNLSDFIEKNNGAIKEIIVTNEKIIFDNNEFLYINNCKLLFNKVTDGCLVKIDMKYTLEIICDRCLKELKSSYSNTFYVSIVFINNIKKSETSNIDGDLVLKTNSNEVDLNEIIRQHELSSRPMKYICSNDCKGLCNLCGVNLNINICKCQKNLL